MHIFEAAGASTGREEDVVVIPRQLTDSADVQQVSASVRVGRFELFLWARGHAGTGGTTEEAAVQEAAVKCRQGQRSKS